MSWRCKLPDAGILFASPAWGEEADWDHLPVIAFHDGRITLEDGTEAEFTKAKGALRFSFPVADASPERAIATLWIDRGSEGLLQGWRYLADHPVVAMPDPDKELPDGDRFGPVRLIREDKLAAFRAEQSQHADAQRRICERFDVNARPGPHRALSVARG